MSCLVSPCILKQTKQERESQEREGREGGRKRGREGGRVGGWGGQIQKRAKTRNKQRTQTQCETRERTARRKKKARQRQGQNRVLVRRKNERPRWAHSTHLSPGAFVRLHDGFVGQLFDPFVRVDGDQYGTNRSVNGVLGIANAQTGFWGFEWGWRGLGLGWGWRSRHTGEGFMMIGWKERRKWSLSLCSCLSCLVLSCPGVVLSCLVLPCLVLVLSGAIFDGMTKEGLSLFYL